MAPNADETCGRIADYLSDALEMSICFVGDMPWQQREKLFDRGEIDVCWICSLPYVSKASSGNLEICAAPVMCGARYSNQPVYFSDVIVRRESHFQSFSELRGASWAYNEPRSHSGYNVVRHHLAKAGTTEGFFGNVVESGAHQTSLEMVLDGRVDASAIDSTVLEAELRARPELGLRMRRIEILGPSPMPPWIVRANVSSRIRTQLGHALRSMHSHSTGAAVLHGWGISHFAAVGDRHYDVVRTMARESSHVRLGIR